MQIDTTHLPADEALFLGASFAHIALFYERQRLARIQRANRDAIRHWQRSR